MTHAMGQERHLDVASQTWLRDNFTSQSGSEFGDLKKGDLRLLPESDSGHPFSSPLSKNSRNTVYELRFANVLGRINGDLKTVIWDCSLQSDSEHPIFSPFSRTKKRGFLEGFFFAKMYASLGCGVLRAKCIAGSNILRYFLFSWAWHWILQKPPLLKPPFLGYWPLSKNSRNTVYKLRFASLRSIVFVLVTRATAASQTLPRDPDETCLAAKHLHVCQPVWEKNEEGFACICAKWCVLASIFGFLCSIVRSCVYFPAKNVGPAPLQKCVGAFCCIISGLCGGFSCRRIFLGTFSHKNKKNLARKFTEKSGGQKITIRKKSVLPKNDPKICLHRPCYIIGESSRGNTIRGNRAESLWEGNLPLRGSLILLGIRIEHDFLELWVRTKSKTFVWGLPQHFLEILFMCVFSPISWAHSKDYPHTEGTFTGTLMNVGDLRRNSGECQGGAREHGVVGSPKFARVRQTSPKFAWRRAHASRTLNKEGAPKNT